MRAARSDAARVRGRAPLPHRTLSIRPILHGERDRACDRRSAPPAAMTASNARHDPADVAHGHTARMLAALRDPACYGHAVERIEILETHISWVILTGRYAYKIKKPVNLGFLDFTSLAARRHYCEEELRLNRRFAPDLYLGVLAVTGDRGAPRLGGRGTAIEYAVKMREFPQSDLLGAKLATGELSARTLQTLAAGIAAFHAA